MFNLWFICSCLLISGHFDLCGSVNVSKITVTKIKRVIKLFEEGFENRVGAILVREWPASQTPGDATCTADECRLNVDWYTSPPILLWDVFHSHPELISCFSCPFCSAAGAQVSGSLRRSGKWADSTWASSSYEPRVVYDSNTALLLVSHIYICPSDHQVPSYHASILSALPSSVYVPFFLTNRAGFTVDMLTQISSMVDNGLSFHSIENLIRDQYQQSYCRLRLRYQEDISRCKCTCKEHQIFPNFDQKWFPFPHEKLVRSVFISYALLFDQIFYDDMASRTSNWISCDHTFKSAANIGFTRESDGRWIKVMKCVFCVLGTDGKILHWRFTRGESFNEVSGVFQELKTRYEQANVILEGIIIDNCCKWKGLLSQIFPHIVVKLDLFHAVQRFVSSLPMEVRLNTDICKAYGLVFRASNDLDNKRFQATPDRKTLLGNLESFERKWASKIWKGNYVLNPAAKKEICNIKMHIAKDCLSNIPIHISTSGNERLHRHMNNILKTNKIGLDTAYVRCSRLFFKINSKGSSDDSMTSLLACSSAAANFPGRAEHFGLEEFCMENEEGLALPRKGVLVYKSLEELNAEVLCRIKNTISASLSNDHIHNDHEYIQDQENENKVELSVAYSALTFYEIYKGSNDIGATRLISKSSIPRSIGLENTFNAFITDFGHSSKFSEDSTKSQKSAISGHLEGFGLEEIEVEGDGNCFFTTVAFQLSNLMTSMSSNEHVIGQLGKIGLTSSMTVQELSSALRNLVVQEWRGDLADEYVNFLPDDIDYFTEVVRYEIPGFYGGPLGYLMPMAMVNLLGIPLVIITSEPSNPLISVCPHGSVITPTPIFMAYISSGPGHYNAVSQLPSPSPPSDVQNSEGCTERQVNEKPKAMTLSRKGCRCGQSQQSKNAKTYRSYKRCKCVLKFKTCCDRCKCRGRCGGVMCKPKVFKVIKKKNKNSPRSKHTLQKSRKEIPKCTSQDKNPQNFLEVCVLCAVAHFVRYGYINSWDANTVYTLYTGVIDALMTLGIVLPLRRSSQNVVWKKIKKLKEDFDY